MPEKLTAQEINSETDPSVAKQFDDETSTDQKFKDFYSQADEQKVCLMSTYRSGVGPVARSMSIAQRSGPDFLFLANAHSKKFNDLQTSKDINLTFQDSKTQAWISVTGQGEVVGNDDSRLKAVYSKPVSAWFGDLKDGMHTGGPEDPRMKLIIVKSQYISYWQSQVGKAGFAKEIGEALFKGEVAQTGVLRQMTDDEIKQARSTDSTLTS
ncbi:hypothetical protein MBLNU230_g7170t1 [Neophaeotheca triangularis]